MRELRVIFYLHTCSVCVILYTIDSRPTYPTSRRERMNTTTLTNEDRAIYSRLSMWNGDEAYQYANTVDAENIDFSAMLARREQIERTISAGLAQDYDSEVIGMALQDSLLKLA